MGTTSPSTKSSATTSTTNAKKSSQPPAKSALPSLDDLFGPSPTSSSSSTLSPKSSTNNLLGSLANGSSKGSSMTFTMPNMDQPKFTMLKQVVAGGLGVDYSYVR